MAGKPAVFVDRDGTINRDVPYCSHPDQFELLPGTAEAIRLLNESGFQVIVVTNQSGVGRGYFTEETLGRIHERMKSVISKYQAYIDGIYYCPHHPDDHCQCRKPEPQMVLKAALELGIDLKQSYTIGDSDADVEMGKRSGCKGTVKIGKSLSENADYQANSLLEGVKWIIKNVSN
jgi:histidinol-phosphate phosphatase family protein